MKRRAHIEFTGKRNVIITTPYRQKKFDIENKDNNTIDLLSLKLAPYDYEHPPSDFYAVILKLDEEVKYNDDLQTSEYCLQVFARTAATRYSAKKEFTQIGLSHIGSRRDVLYQVTIT